jgi:DeoR/GlpR family transcriptional regulator of sugar metabolism
MLKNERQNQILQLLQQDRSVSLSDLSKHFDVSDMTIWRDLDELSRAGLIKRIRGGALVRESAHIDIQDFSNDFQGPRAAKKSAIGDYAARHLINIGDSITIEAGTTARSIIPYLNTPNLTILTNGLLTCMSVYQSKTNMMLMCSGGVLIENGAFIGPQAEDFFANFHTQKAFLGAEGLTIKEEFTDSTPLYTNLKKVMKSKADQTIMMLDSSKIGVSSLVQVMKINEVDILVTDCDASPDVINSLRQCGIDVHIAEPKEARDL